MFTRAIARALGKSAIDEAILPSQNLESPIVQLAFDDRRCDFVILVFGPRRALKVGCRTSIEHDEPSAGAKRLESAAHYRRWTAKFMVGVRNQHRIERFSSQMGILRLSPSRT